MNDELQNIEDMFVANGYERNEVKRCLREKVKETTEETREYRGVVNIPYVKGLSEQFKRVEKTESVSIGRQTESSCLQNTMWL